MNTGVLWRVAIQTTSEAEERIGELLFNAFRVPVSSYTDLRCSVTRVEAYLPSRPPNIRQSAEGIRAELAKLSAEGIDVGPGRLTLRRLPRKNWAESWKRHFQPLEIGRKLLLKPSWSRRKPRRGCTVVVLDPGLSFGTGHHPTTAFCLQQLVKFRQPDRLQSILDVGTGSGVLAIAAGRLGYDTVKAFDLDPEAIRSARANARRNRLSHVQFFQQDLTKPAPRLGLRRYSVVCANLTVNLLIDQRELLLAWLQPGGLLVLAGILKEEFGRVQRHYEKAGLRLVAGRTKGEWRSGSFRLRA